MYVCWLPQPFVSSDIYVYVIMLYFADIAFGHTFKHARTPASNAIRWQLSIVWGGVKHASMSGKAAVVSALSGVFSVRHHATSALDRREVHYPCMSCWPTGNHPVFRWTLGWMTPPQVTFLKLPATKNIRWEMMNERVYQDIVLPLHTLETAISRAADLFGIWPLLVYPSRIYNHGKHAQGLFREPHPDSVVPGTNYGMYYDLGVYGIPREVRRKEPYDNVSTMRMMEEYTRCVGGAPFDCTSMSAPSTELHCTFHTFTTKRRGANRSTGATKPIQPQHRRNPRSARGQEYTRTPSCSLALSLNHHAIIDVFAAPRRRQQASAVPLVWPRKRRCNYRAGSAGHTVSSRCFDGGDDRMNGTD
eukprot:m.386586 g.386586  ORF g.386586 m.386586 type:complete len:361 (+) comp21018_c1_seq2:178-1260(+)